MAAAPPRFINVRTGLLEPRHVRAMGGGSPLVLYLWLHERVYFRGEQAGTTREPYRHEDAAAALGCPRTSIRRWFAALIAGGYVATVRRRTGLEVTITKYVTVAQECPPVDTHAAQECPKMDSPSARVSTDGQSGLPRVSTSGPRVSKNGHPVIRKKSQQIQQRELPPLNPPPVAVADATRAAPTPNRYTDFIDAVRAAGVAYEPSPVDAKAVNKGTTLTPAQIAEVYAAIASGEHGDDWWRDRLSAATAIKAWNGYQAAKHGRPRPPPAAQSRGRVSVADVAARKLRERQAAHQGPRQEGRENDGTGLEAQHAPTALRLLLGGHGPAHQ